MSSVRASIIAELFAETIGPRGGVGEILEARESPEDQYLSGVLAPATEGAGFDGEQPLDGPEPPSRDLGDTDAEGAPTFGLADEARIDPRKRPHSIGLSLQVRDGSHLSVAVTWARYLKDKEGGHRRIVHGGELAWTAGAPRLTVRPDPDDADTEVLVTCRSISLGVTSVLIHLTNRRLPHEAQRPSSEDYIFQPQIRVMAGDLSDILPISTPTFLDAEELRLAMSYRDSAVYARGLMCGAIWQDIDPEHPAPAPLEATRPPRPPFEWADGQVVFKDRARHFTAPHARTELMPAVNVPAPDKSWDDRFQSPTLAPHRLAQCHSKELIREALTPLTHAYEAWAQASESDPVLGDTIFRAPAQDALAEITDVARRIRQGIALLEDDPLARAAFCFANEAIARQSRWSKQVRALDDSEPNDWYPFQLAFILMLLPSTYDCSHEDRDVCDLLWFPTGGGKTEAYLGLTAFAIASQRLRNSSTGTIVISRYTLRLLTIQQFRRALSLITACEVLRNEVGADGLRGWWPRGLDRVGNGHWGDQRISIGLWAGSSVTSNDLQDRSFRNAAGNLEIIHGALSTLRHEPAGGAAPEPAQVLNCPVCGAVLAVPRTGSISSPLTLDLRIYQSSLSQPHVEGIRITRWEVSSSNGVNFLKATVEWDGEITGSQLREKLHKHLLPAVASVDLLRPGYLVTENSKGHALDFEIYCPNRNCELNAATTWSELTPAGPWTPPTHVSHSGAIPIPAWSVDTQVYGHLPTMLLSTVDKFVRIAYTPAAAGLLGRVDRYMRPTAKAHPVGYGRLVVWESGEGLAGGNPVAASQLAVATEVAELPPPSLIIQDELHLLEGPLGSMVGVFESALDALLGTDRCRPKYVASSATVRAADSQVAALFDRRLGVFPPQGLRASESFFSRPFMTHILDDTRPGRLYVGLAAPARGAQTPITRVWSRVLQHLHDLRTAGAELSELDPYWTLVGYFNALRELAGAASLARADLAERLRSFPNARVVDQPMELSSRTDSIDLPLRLDDLGKGIGAGARDLVLTTSIFGTGVDVNRLGLMFVNGQPKTAAQYIQASGRVGRQRGGLVLTFLRVSKPRDLSHYEYFTGFHQSLYRFVEPVTVNPFATRALERAAGVALVAYLRNWEAAAQNSQWPLQSDAQRMAAERNSAIVSTLINAMERRAQRMPPERRPPTNEVSALISSLFDRWALLAQQNQGDEGLWYYEAAIAARPKHAVVLGTRQHEELGFDVVFPNSPQTMREVESTFTLKGWAS